MATGPRLALFALGALAAFGAAFGVGRTVGPTDDAPPSDRIEHDAPSSPGPATPGHADGHQGGGS